MQSHEIPSPLVHSRLMTAWLRFPKYMLLVRDIRDAMVSHFEKKRHLEPFSGSFSQYLRNERIVGNEVRRDIWHRMRLLNAWNRDFQKLPAERLLIVRYEDLRASPPRELERVWNFFDLPPQPAEAFTAAAAASTKDKMQQHERSDAPLKIVRSSNQHPHEWFDADDRAFFTQTVSRHLQNWFGYDYHCWAVPVASATVARRAA